MTHAQTNDSNSKKWMKLDNAAKIYPASMSRNWTALFRLSAELDEPVDPEILRKAQERTLRRFPGFAHKLKYGAFWFYLEQLEGAPEIQRDVLNPCVRMNLKENNGFMFRVRYHQNRIAVEIFHALTDGTGGLCFLKTLVAEYLELKHGIKIPRSDKILDCDAPPPPEELEDSYLKYSRHITKGRSEPVSYPIRGTDETEHFMNIITGTIPASELLAKAKEHGVTVTVFLTAALIMAVRAIQKTEKSKRKRKMPVKICVPVNMRRFYPTKTMRNFSMYINPGIFPKYGDYTFEEALKVVHHYLGLEMTEKKLNARMTANVNVERSKVISAVPLFLKKPAMKFAFKMKGDRQSSTIISNLGRAELPPEMERHVKRMDFMLGSLYKNRVTCAVLTYRDDMMINFTRAIVEPSVERNFFTLLVKMGIHVKIESNQRY